MTADGDAARDASGDDPESGEAESEHDDSERGNLDADAPDHDDLEPGCSGPWEDHADTSDGDFNHLEVLLPVYATTKVDDPERASLRERLVTGYLPLAHGVARRYAHRGELLDDLEQVAGIGLLNAIDRFDPAQGHPFVAFAVPTITGEIRRHFRDRTWSMRIPRRLKDLYVAINQESAGLYQELSRAPRPSEIAARLDMRTEEVLEGLHVAQAYRSRSLDRVLTDDNDATLHSLLGADDMHFEKIINSRSLAVHLAALPPRERDILLMRFYDDMTQSQIGERIGISQMHVSRLLSSTLTHLRDAVDEDRPPSTAPPTTKD